MIDETFHLTPLDVRRFEFGRSMRGYDPARVEEFRSQAADESERAVGEQFLRAKQLNRGDAKHGLVTKKPAHDDNAGDGGKHNGAENSRTPTADYFLDDEQDSGNGSVEGGGQSGGGAHGSDQPKFFARQSKASSQDRSEAGANLQGRIFRSKRVAGSDGQRSSDEFSDCGDSIQAGRDC